MGKSELELEIALMVRESEFSARTLLYSGPPETLRRLVKKHLPKVPVEQEGCTVGAEGHQNHRDELIGRQPCIGEAGEA